MKKNRRYNDSFNEFVYLKLSRDRYGRSNKIIKKSLGSILTKGCYLRKGCNIRFRYVRQFYIKKIIILSFLMKINKEKLYNSNYLSSDFKFDIMKFLLTNLKLKSSVKYNVKQEENIAIITDSSVQVNNSNINAGLDQSSAAL